MPVISPIPCCALCASTPDPLGGGLVSVVDESGVMPVCALCVVALLPRLVGELTLFVSRPAVKSI